MELYFIIAILVLVVAILILQLFFGSRSLIKGVITRLDQNEKSNERIENSVRNEIKSNRQELNSTFAAFQNSFIDALNNISKAQLEQLRLINDSNREELARSLKEFQSSFDRNVESFNNLQKEKFSSLETKQSELIADTAKKLDLMRETVDEKLQKTLNERLGQSFELVSRQLESVQKGLGEMQNLAQDVGGLKKVLSNVKMRGGLGEVRLEMLLEQVLAPEQYESNVKTKLGSTDLVEFAIKLPGKDDDRGVVYLPIDAKFPQEAYHNLVDMYELGDPELIESASKKLDNVIRKMAHDIHDKYIDPPNTTEFGIMFLPFEGLYAEVIRRTNLMEQLQRDYHIMVTGPTTLAAILNSLQMGFKTLAIQKRSGEVWKVLGAIKTEFEKFGGMLEKAQKNLHTASNQLDELVGKRTKAIQRKLREVESLPQSETTAFLPLADSDTEGDEEEQVENESEHL
ncbi:MAG TPA: DNA recombination protein RmuC [Bacteroidales bacterium]|jgi:DNA recombination protein RmuC|nr:DNA recombination protein RmuC [Bacteroidales bacterium]